MIRGITDLYQAIILIIVNFITSVEMDIGIIGI